ncbi:MAG: P-loop NTPase [Microbacteriaceae bacterium]|nr:P-loop NTPase [Microbacteriaceae bacterium]MDR9443812.1 P-loop NTPase [Microbacteriaceae bacterium]
MTQKVIEALSRVIDPELRQPITELGMVGEIHENPGSVQIKLTIVGCPASQKIEREVREALQPVGDYEVEMTVMTAEERNVLKDKLRSGKPVKHNPFIEETNTTRVIFVGSGKGGVGKSTLTANLAVGLANRGLKVGLLDADIFGYSIPGQLGISEKPTKVDELILPPIAHEVKVISIGMFVEKNQPVGWRGPMLHRAIEQFLTDVYWGDLDFLLVDLPPGTGDVAISLGQLLPKAYSLVVTTPQPAASDVAERSGAIGLQTGQKIIGVVENMSYLLLNGKRQNIFGEGGGDAVAKRLSELSGEDVEVLARIPMDEKLREASDSGKPDDALPDAGPELSKLIDKISKIPIGLDGKKLKLNLG